MNKKEKTKKGKRYKKIKRKKCIHITYDILPSGTLERNPSSFTQTPKERWEEIVDICADVISESRLE